MPEFADTACNQSNLFPAFDGGEGGCVSEGLIEGLLEFFKL